MNAENYQEFKDLLRRILDAESSRRREMLEKADVSAEIRSEVESLIALEEEMGDFMSLPISDFSKDFTEDLDETETLPVGRRIGNYEIIGELGHGGMGAVYLARRADGKFEQKVALKLLKRELNASALRHRFEQEREILASLEHPFIARLLDAGTTDDHIPFLTMEYVEGLPINDYCNINSLDLNERLDLFRKVCDAVAFAHRNLIVHRDLKPSNILIDAQRNPKLLDFGISKILSNEFERKNKATITKLGAMTPGYASPEQLQSKSVTTATDIYSLGVILYELLSGHRPFETKENNLPEIYKAVLETDPPLPSSIIADFGLQTSELQSNAKLKSKDTKSQNNETNPRFKIRNPQLKGDLDNIVLKALRKEPERRYSSVESFAEDIHRYLRGLPVTAQPNTFFYRAGKFINRNRFSTTAAGLLFFAVVAGIAATLWQAQIARAERDRTRIESEKANKVSGYMQNILNFSNPHWLSSNPKRNREATIAEALDEALKNIDRDLGDEPEIQAEILLTLGQTYIGQAQYEKSEKLLRQSVEKFNQVLGEKNLKAMQASIILGDALYLLGNYDEAEKLYTEAIEYFRPVAAEDPKQTRWLAIAWNDLGNVKVYRADDAEAEKAYREAVELSRNLTGNDRFIVPIALGSLGNVRHSLGYSEEAFDYYNQASEEIRLTGGENSMENGNLLSKIGVAYNDIGDYKRAEDYFQKAHDILLKLLGEENGYTALIMSRLAHNYYKQERFEEAEKMITKSLEIYRKLLPKGHFVISNAERILGGIYTKTNRVEKGETLLRKSINYFSERSKNPTRDIALAKMTLSENLMAQKRFAEARENVTEALEISLNLAGEKYHLTQECREILSRIPQ